MSIVPDTRKESIGARLAAVRKVRAMSASTIANALKISPQRWNTYEQGRSIIPPDLLSKFWQVTGATSDYVLFGRMDGLPAELYLALSEKDDDLEQRA